jgi:hypothetical protein
MWFVQFRPHTGIPWRQPKTFPNREQARNYLLKKLSTARPDTQGCLLRSPNES